MFFPLSVLTHVGGRYFSTCSFVCITMQLHHQWVAGFQCMRQTAALYLQHWIKRRSIRWPSVVLPCFLSASPIYFSFFYALLFIRWSQILSLISPSFHPAGFADIPSGPSCPYIVRRGLLGTSVLPVPQKDLGQEEETDWSTATGNLQTKALTNTVSVWTQSKTQGEVYTFMSVVYRWKWTDH